MKRTLLFVALLMLMTASAFAQAPVPVPAADPMGANGVLDAEVGTPPAGEYPILINGWIEAYAVVSAWDNWIDFGVMSPTAGTYDAPAPRYAWQNGAAGLLTGEIGAHQPNLYALGNAVSDDHDVAGIQVQTNARLNLQIDPGYHMRRCDANGAYTAQVDTRKSDSGYYMLRNQLKMVMRGKFLNYAGPTDPLFSADGTAYVSPTSLQATAYNTWTDWSPTGPTIVGDAGWLDLALATDPWTGEPAYYAPVGGATYGTIDMTDVIIERGQADVDGGTEAAELWFTQRVLRRGLQDVAGNYRSDMGLLLTYREGESDARWTPDEKATAAAPFVP